MAACANNFFNAAGKWNISVHRGVVGQNGNVVIFMHIVLFLGSALVRDYEAFSCLSIL